MYVRANPLARCYIPPLDSAVSIRDYYLSIRQKWLAYLNRRRIQLADGSADIHVPDLTLEFTRSGIEAV